MGGRGLRGGGATAGRFVRVKDAQGRHIGLGYEDPVSGEVMMMPGMYGTNTNVIPLAKQVPIEDAIAETQKGLSDSGVKLTKNQSSELATALILSGSLIGGGDIRTRLYRAARLIGDFRAVTGGSKTLVSRIGRRLTGRISGGLFRKLFG